MPQNQSSRLLPSSLTEALPHLQLADGGLRRLSLLREKRTQKYSQAPKHTKGSKDPFWCERPQNELQASKHTPLNTCQGPARCWTLAAPREKLHDPRVANMEHPQRGVPRHRDHPNSNSHSSHRRRLGQKGQAGIDATPPRIETRQKSAAGGRISSEFCGSWF